MADDLEQQLQRWGDETAPSPDPAFANRLEADLRSAAYFGRRTTAPEPRRRWVLRPAFVMATVALVALVAAVALNITDGDPVDTLVMGDSSDTTVTLPGGTVQEGGEGLELPDGTVIDVGPDGFATVDGVVLGPDSRALVVDGHLELLDPDAREPSGPDDPTDETALPTIDPAVATATPTPTPTPIGVPVDPPPATPPVPTSTPAPTRRPADVAPEPTPTRAPTVRPTATPMAVDPTPTPTSTATATPSSAVPTPTATPEPEPARPRVDLGRTYLGPERAALVWTVTRGDAIAGWEVRIRRGDTIRTVAVLRHGAARELVVERPMRNTVFYRVIARDAAGRVLAQSNEVRVVAAEVPADG